MPATKAKVLIYPDEKLVPDSFTKELKSIGYSFEYLSDLKDYLNSDKKFKEEILLIYIPDSQALNPELFNQLSSHSFILFLGNEDSLKSLQKYSLPSFIDYCAWPSTIETIRFRIAFLEKAKREFHHYYGVIDKDQTSLQDKSSKEVQDLRKMLKGRTKQLVKALAENISYQKGQSGTAFKTDYSDLFISTLIDTIPVPIYFKNNKGEYLECNKSFCEIFALSREKIIGSRLDNLLQSDLAGIMQAEEDQMMDGDGVIDTEKTIHHHDGSFRNFMIMKRRIDLGEDEFGLIGILWDLTEVRQNQKLLKTQYTINYLAAFNRGLRPSLKYALGLVFEFEWVDVGGIYLFNRNKTLLKLEYHKGLTKKFAKDVSSYSRSSEQFRLVMQKQIFISDYSKYPEIHKLDSFSNQFKGIVVIPLIDPHKKSVIGSLNLASKRYGTISENDRLNFETIASRIVLLVKYAKAQEDLKKAKNKLRQKVIVRNSQLKAVNLLLEDEVLLQKRTSDSLKESRKLYQGIFESSQEGIVLYDADTLKLVDLNKKTHEDLGYTREEFLKLNPDEFTIYKNKEERESILKTLFNNGQVTYQVRNITKDGRVLHRNVNSSILKINSNKYILGSIHDITNLVEKEKEIRASEKKHKDLQNNIPIGIFTTTMEGTISYGNETLKKMLNIQEHKLHEFTAQDFYMDKKQRERIVADLMRCGRITNVELMVKPLTGKSFWAKTNIRMALDNKGLPDHMEGTLEDISAQKKFELELIKANKKIKKMVKTLRKKVKKAIYRHDAQQSMLIQKSKLESLGELAAGIAHEINQPLGIMSLSLENLQAKIHADETSLAYLDKKFNSIDNNINRIRDIIDHIRIFSRDQDAPTLDKVNMNKIIRKALSLIGVQYRNYNIHIRLDLAENLGFTIGSNIKMEQAILNLLSNAKYAVDDKSTYLSESEYTKEIFIKTAVLNDKIHFLIQDNGVGIEEKNIARIFDPFFTTKPEGQGTGLGLSIIYGIIKDMRGEIKVDSKIMEFTKFEIILPRFPENV